MQHSEFNQIELAPSKKMTGGGGKSRHRCSLLVTSELSITEHRIHKHYTGMFSGKLAGVAHIVCCATLNQALFCEVYFCSSF